MFSILLDEVLDSQNRHQRPCISSLAVLGAEDRGTRSSKICMKIPSEQQQDILGSAGQSVKSVANHMHFYQDRQCNSPTSHLVVSFRSYQ